MARAIAGRTDTVHAKFTFSAVSGAFAMSDGTTALRTDPSGCTPEVYHRSLMSLVLASQSPRRAELLAAAGIVFTARAANVDEQVLPGELPDGHVRRLARAKAQAIAADMPDVVVLGADTVVVVDGEILGKPRDGEDARRMLALLSGRRHEVFTGVAVACQGRVVDTVEVSTVDFAPLTPAEIGWYVASGEPLDKAGAYAIQGLASRFVTRIAGSYSNIVGMPVAQTCALLAKAGHNLSLGPGGGGDGLGGSRH